MTKKSVVERILNMKKEETELPKVDDRLQRAIDVAAAKFNADPNADLSQIKDDLRSLLVSYQSTSSQMRSATQRRATFGKISESAHATLDLFQEQIR